MKTPDIGINDADRAEIVEGLNKILASSFALYMKTLNFHWNVTGPHFGPLHEMFQTQYTDLAEANDELAERIRALGFLAPGGLNKLADLSVVKDSTEDLKAEEMVDHLLQGHEALIKLMRDVIGKAADVRDEATNDLLTARIDTHEKTAWMLRSILG